MAFLSVDAGTSLIKCVAFDAEGRELGIARRRTAVLHPTPDRAEQDMETVWSATVACVREAAAALDGEAVELVATTAQGDGCWLVDAEGRPAGHAALWLDARAAAIVDRWDAEGRLEAAFRRTGCLGFPGLAHAVLAWMAEHDPAAIPQGGTLLSCGAWVHHRLSGERVADPSDMGNPFLPLDTGAYDDELLDLFDLRWARPLLPELRDGAGRVGELSAEAAAETGLPAGTPVVLGPYDVVATALGVGAAAPGQASAILGTTLAIETMTAEPRLDGPPAGMTLFTGVPGRYLRMFATLSGTGVVDWACDLLGLADPAELSRLAAAAPAAGGPMVLPYLSPAGERAPFRDGRARGTILGLDTGHGREAIARAVLEGLALTVRDCLQAADAEPTELRLCGGGAASELWCQLIADACGVPVRRPDGSEAGAKGALATALVATGACPDIDAAVARLVRPGATFTPDPARREALERTYARFSALRDSAREHVWPLAVPVPEGEDPR